MFKEIFTVLLIVSQVPLVKPTRWADCPSIWPRCVSKNKDNIVCTEPNCDPKDSCTEIHPDAKFRRWMLKGHNEKRDFLASGEEKRGGMGNAVANMAAVSYSLELEYTAICNCHRCKMEHDKCRITKTFDTAGQNLAMKGTSKIILDEKMAMELINDWYEEVALQDLSGSIDEFHSSTGTGHFTALIWAQTTHIGCAWTIKNKTKGDVMEKVFLACNYGPAGNVIGRSMLVKGDPCTKCESGVPCGSVYKHLCGEESTQELNGPNPFRDTELGNAKARINSPVLLILFVAGLVAKFVN